MKTCCGSTLTRVFGIQRERIHVFLLEEDSMTQRARRNISELSVPYRFPTHDQQNQLEVVDIMGPWQFFCFIQLVLFIMRLIWREQEISKLQYWLDWCSHGILIHTKHSQVVGSKILHSHLDDTSAHFFEQCPKFWLIMLMWDTKLPNCIGILVNLVNHYRDPCELFHVTPLAAVLKSCPGKLDVTSSSPKMPQASHGSVVYLWLNGKVHRDVMRRVDRPGRRQWCFFEIMVNSFMTH